jgi:hypothetical protein
MNILLILVWLGFFYCFYQDIRDQIPESPDRWPGHRLRHF